MGRARAHRERQRRHQLVDGPFGGRREAFVAYQPRLGHEQGAQLRLV